MELVGIDFGTCNIKVVRRAGESYKNFRIDNTSNDLKKGTANKVFYRDNELLLGDKATKGRNRCKTVEEQNNYIENIKEHLQEKNWKQTLADGQIKSAGDVTGDIMQYIYHRFSEELQESIDAVITVPVIFSEYQINMIRKAAEDAGFHVKKIISEPFASFVYLMQDCIEAMEKRLHHVLMFDIGGGTLDICLISCGVKEGQYEVSVQSAIGVDRGGNEINDEILNDILFNKNKEMFQAVLYQDEKDAHKAFRNRVNRYSVMEEIEDLKNEMFHDEIKKQSRTIEFSFEKPDYDEDIDVTAKDIYHMLDQNHWKDMIFDMLEELFWESDDIAPEDLTDVFLAGGTSAIPYFRECIIEFLEEQGVEKENCGKLFQRNDEAEADDRRFSSVAYGAAWFNQFLHGDLPMRIQDEIPFKIYTKKGEAPYATLEKNSGADNYSFPKKLLLNEKDRGKIDVYQEINTVIPDGSENNKEVYVGYFNIPKDIEKGKEELYRFRFNHKNVLEIQYFHRELENDEMIPVIDSTEELVYGV